MKTTYSSFRLGSALALASVFAAVTLSGGVRYEMAQKGDSDESPSVTILVGEGKIKVGGAAEDAGEMIYSVDRKEMIIVDHGDRVFTKLDEPTVQRIADRMKTAMAEYEAALENVPPAQRQMVERMMRQQMGSLAAQVDVPEIEYKETGEKEQVGDYETRVFEVLTNGRKTQELYVADWSDVKGGEDFATAFESMSTFFQDIMAALAQGPMATMLLEWSGDNWLDSFSEAGGFPVKVREFGPTGETAKETTLVSVEELAVSDSDFQPPAGYRERNIGL